MDLGTTINIMVKETMLKLKKGTIERNTYYSSISIEVYYHP